SVGISLNRRTDHFNFFTQMGLGHRSLPRYNKGANFDIENNSEIRTDGVNYRNEKFYNLTLGTDYHINNLNVLTLSGSFAYEVEDQPSNTQYNAYDNNVLSSSWIRTETTKADNPKWQYELNYDRIFKDNEKHNLVVSAIGSFFGKDQSSYFTNKANFGTIAENDQKNTTNFKQADYTFKADYTKPFNKKYTIETGAQYLINDVGNDYATSDLINDEWVLNNQLTNNFEYDQKVLGVYGTGSYEGEKWGLKAGVRLENTSLFTQQHRTGQVNNNHYTNLFPSLHTSYKLSAEVSLQLGYSRRIYRPRLWDLNPFFNNSNNYNIRTGNPDLNPEYSDSYELTGIFKLGKATLNSSLYYRYTTAVIERVSTFENNVSITKPYNVGTSGAPGLEMNGRYSPIGWLSFNGDFNFNYFKRKGTFQSQIFDFNGNRWSGRLTTKIDLPADFAVELNGNYQSAYKSVNATNTAFSYLDAGVRKKLWKGKLVANLSVNDIFASRIFESETSRPQFYIFNQSYRGRFFTFGLSYGFGKGEAMTYSGGRRR
ncbi:MAG: outer membrane beta-barrel family protein, partial [Niabella sp.]